VGWRIQAMVVAEALRKLLKKRASADEQMGYRSAFVLRRGENIQIINLL
jgi:hypothetical protein